MTSRPRNDIHRPSAADFDPATYTVVGVFDLHLTRGADEHSQAVRDNTAKGYRFAAHQQAKRCGHCGARVRYAALMLHETSADMIYVGETCLNGTFAGTKAAFRALRKQAKATRRLLPKKEQFSKNLDDAVSRDWTLEILGNGDACANLPNNVRDFALDVRAHLFKRSLTNRQVQALAKAIDRSRQWEAARRAEQDTSIPVPTGQQTVRGVVRSTKTAPNPRSPYGSPDAKMTVRDASGFTVFCTAPAPLVRIVGGLEHLRGRTIEFDAALTRSDDDETFGFAKRPRSACLVSTVE